MFMMRLPKEAEELLYILQADYPRASDGIRCMWGPEKDNLAFFKDLLTYQSDASKQGFSPEAFSLLSKIRDIYIREYIEFKCISLSKVEAETFRRNIMDVWDRALF
jgi:hypothetical protein